MTDPRIARMIDDVSAYEPVEDLGRSGKEQLLELLRTAEAPFSREADLSHVTASAVVLSPSGVLLHRHKLSGDWYGPGGHVDEGEDPWDAAARETLEETGIAGRHPEAGPTLVHIDVHRTSVGHVHYDLRYLLLAEAEEPNPPPGESQDVEWFSQEDAWSRTDDSCRAAMSAAWGFEGSRLR